MDTKLLPFYFPTSVVLIDDSSTFFKYFSLLLKPTLSYYMFNSPVKALEFINGQKSISENINEYFDIGTLDNADERTFLDPESLHKHIYNPIRFSRISTVVVDYSMPEMNGLQLCEQIIHPEIKRILLTGIADEKTAVKAFNEGLIDRFFLKNSAELDKDINNAIVKLQHAYFKTVTDPLTPVMMNFNPGFISDKQFDSFFKSFLSGKNWAEYYLWDVPQGIILLDISGNTSFLFIVPGNELDTHYEIASAGNAPAEMLALLKNKRHIAFFPTNDGYFTEDCILWEDYLYPVEFYFGDKQTYLCALVSPAPPHIIDPGNITAYSTYLDSMDLEV